MLQNAFLSVTYRCLILPQLLQQYRHTSDNFVSNCLKSKQTNHQITTIRSVYGFCLQANGFVFMIGLDFFSDVIMSPMTTRHFDDCKLILNRAFFWVFYKFFNNYFI